MQFYSYDLTEAILRGQQDGPSHARAKVNKGVSIDGGCRAAATPANQHGLEDGRSNRVVRSGMLVIVVPGNEMTSGNQTTCTDTEFEVEWMADIAILDCQPGKEAPLL